MDLNRSLESGADDFISKSKDLAVLLARIQALVRHRYLQDESGRIFEVLSARTLDALNAHVAPARTEIEGKHDREAGGKPGAAQAQLAASERIAPSGQPMVRTSRAIDEPLAFVVSNLSVVESGLDSLCVEMGMHLSEDSLRRLRDTRVRLRDMRQGLDRMKELAVNLPSSSGLDGCNATNYAAASSSSAAASRKSPHREAKC